MISDINIGDRFGHLIVINKDNRPRHKASWLCRCECGNTIELHASAILAGKKTSCGCVHHAAKHPHEDLTGRRFGHLTVISRSSNPKYKSLWQCICDCGKELSVYTSALLKGKYTSCGNCHYHMLHTKESIIGKRFHHLTITKIVETEPGQFKLLCRCDLQIRHRPKFIHHTLTRAQKLKTNDSIRYHKAYSNTGIKGIHMRKRLKHNAYEVAITSQGRYHYIGHFPTLEDAIKARLAAEKQYFAPLIQQLDNSEC